MTTVTVLIRSNRKYKTLSRRDPAGRETWSVFPSAIIGYHIRAG